MKRLLLTAALSFSFTAAAADKYAVDSAHAWAIFKVSHMGFSNSYGMFGDISGDFTLDEQKVENSNINISIKVASVNSNNAKRDDHLKKSDFFDAKQYPTITFKSKSIKKKGDKAYDVTGEMTMHGKTQTVSFVLNRFRTGENPMKKQTTGGEAKFTIKRSQFGMNFMVGEDKIGDDVEIIVSLEGNKI